MKKLTIFLILAYLSFTINSSAVTEDKKNLGDIENVNCDCICVSGYWTPSIHLASQSGNKTKFKNNNAQYLTWKCRSLLEKQIEDYDIFIYLEDDILLYKETLDYWLKYKDLFIKHKCNVGFMRVA